MVKLVRMVGFITWEIQIPCRRVEPFRDTRGPGEEAVAKMFETLGKSDSPKARRDQAILRLLFDLGLRRESIVSLDLQHWSDESRTLQVMLEGHSLRMPKRLPPVTADALKGWIEVRGTQDGALFVRIGRGDARRPDRSRGMGFTT
jgi:integrase/recombinase XerC